jgi:hypothetical protein
LEQEKIEWTKNIVSRLLEEGIGEQSKLQEIQNLLDNNLEISEKDSKYLKKHYSILEKKEEKEQSKLCGRCNKKLGFMKYSPKNHTGYERKVCGDCFTLMNSNHKSFDGKYIEGTIDLKEGTGIELHLNAFDNVSIVITSKKNLFRYPLEDLQSYQEVELEKDSIAKKIITAGLKDKTKSETLELNFLTGSINNRVLLKLKDLEKTMETIYELKKALEAFLESKESQEKTDSAEEQTETETFEAKYGKLIKSTAGGLYYGGHKAYLAGGTFGDSQDGNLYLTERYLVFTKNAIRESKRWIIEIPLDRVIVQDWTVDEKVRRQSAAGGGVGVGFGLLGGGTIHESGKSHDIVVPYIDENGIEQAPRFGVTSLSGNAIREWAKLIYDTLVKVQKEKQSESQQVSEETTKEKQESKPKEDDPLKVLKMRLVKGEITKEEFEELKELID